MKEKYYITTPIYYPSGNWHVGHCYTTVVCDAFARFNKMLGKDVFFLTGTDEHGQKIEKKAKEAGMTPQAFVDGLIEDLKGIWEMLDVKYDKFIRTTDEQHVKSVQKIFETLYKKGEIYKAEYEGHYCTPCESFWTESQLKDGKCPDCGREVTIEKEESYFFRLSKYTDKILALYKDNPEFLQPKSRVNEMINNFLKPGLSDLCVSRTTIKWGVPVTFDEKHTVYVWIDALSNYITALGYGSEDDGLFKKYWPADLHLMAKEIIRFHAIIWPAILMALGEELPKQIYGHGWLMIGGDKLSKSKMDKVKAELVDPKQIVARYGSDALRYYLLREVPFGSDGVFTNENLLGRINSDLANDLGNLVSRTTAMINQYFGGILQAPSQEEEIDEDLKAMAGGLLDKVKSAMERLNAPDALTEIFKVVQRANKYIDETTPWILAKDESKKERLGTVLFNLAETIRIVAVMLKPFMTKSPALIFESLSVDGDAVTDFESVKAFGDSVYGLKPGISIKKLPPIFPRIDIAKELKDIEKFMEENKPKTEEKPNKKHEMPKKPEISFEDFAKLELRIGKIMAVEKVEKADKLLKLTVKLGEETRTIVSGIAAYYTAEELVGKKVTVICNLKPVKLRGILSEGMILAAEDDNGRVVVLQPEKDVDDGCGVF